MPKEISNRKYQRGKWDIIGRWESFQGSYRFEGYIPDWIKKRIFVYLEQIGKERLRKIKDPRKRKELMLRSEVFQGIKYVHDKHYLYKLVFSEGDETNSATISRKRRFF
jgi:hypothetical protein